MSSKKSEPINDIFKKTREQLCKVADSYIALMPGSRRNTPENIAKGQEEYLPDPTRPVRLYVSQGRDQKFWLSTGDFKAILTLYEENKEACESSFTQVGIRAREKADSLAKLFGE